MHFDLLVLDLDGTALTRGRRVSERDQAAVAALLEAGVQISIATGRLFGGAQWVAQLLGIHGSIAVMNGAELVDVDTGQVRSGRYIDPAQATRLRACLRAFGLATFLFASEQIHYAEVDAQHAPYLNIWTEQLRAHPDVFDAPAWEHDRLLAVGSIGTPAAVDAMADVLERELDHPLAAEAFDTWHEQRFIKVRDRSEDKASALEHLARERGVRVERTVAIGDWSNDISMLRRAGLGLAMGHAPEAVKRAADRVLAADREEGGGIAEAAAAIWGIRV